MAKRNEALTELKRQIKEDKLKPLYLFYGEEEYLKEFYITKIEEIVPDGGFPEFNRIKLEGAEIPFSDYDDAWESFPMMTDRKLILIKDSGIFKLKKGREDIHSTDEQKEFWTEKLKHIADDAVVIFSERSVDKRSALYKAVSKAGYVVEFDYLSEADLVTWVLKQCLNAKVKISKDTAQYLVVRCDPGLNNLNNELQKLMTFCDEEIYKSDIDRVVAKSLQVITFELSDAIMAGNTEKTLSVLRDLKTVKENAFTILYLMYSNFDKLLHTKLLAGAPQSEVAARIGAAPFIAKKYIESARGFSEEALIRMVKRVPEIDLAIKEGRVDEWTALEQYVTECIYNAKNHGK